VSSAWAQTADGGGPFGGTPLPSLLFPIGLIFLIFYFFIISPEQKRKREHEQLIAGLKRNDRIAMSCGMHGRVVGLSEKVLTVEIARGVQIEVDRAAIQRVESTAAAEPREKEREKS
jgi:preprotein translocase subunit YajC